MTQRLACRLPREQILDRERQEAFDGLRAGDRGAREKIDQQAVYRFFLGKPNAGGAQYTARVLLITCKKYARALCHAPQSTSLSGYFFSPPPVCHANP